MLQKSEIHYNLNLAVDVMFINKIPSRRPTLEKFIQLKKDKL